MIWISILGIVTLVLFARAIGFARNPALDAPTAVAEAEAALPGFAAATAEIDPATRTARVTARDGRIANVRPHGDRWVVRVDPVFRA